MQNPVCFKFLYKNLTHHGFKYSLGLNVDVHTFNEKEYSPGGLYFTTAEHIWDFYGISGALLCIIEIPTNAVVKHYPSGKSKADRIIISEIISGEAKILERIGDYLIPETNKQKNFCLQATSNNHLEILKYARKKGFNWDHYNGAEVCLLAAKMGFIEILKYTHALCGAWEPNFLRNECKSRNIPFNTFAYIHDYTKTNFNFCVDASKNNHLEVLKYARSICGYDWGSDGGADVCLNAATNNNLEMLKYALENGCKWGDDDGGAEICCIAAKKGNIEMLKYAHTKGCKLGPLVCYIASENGHLDILKYAMNNVGSKCILQICAKNAAMNGHLEIIKHLHSQCEYKLGYEICFEGAKNGHLNIIKYACDNGWEWEPDICIEAVKNGNYDIIHYAHQNRFECDGACKGLDF